MSDPTAADLFREGKLDDAVQAAIADVKKNPKDARRRLFLAELFCFQGNIDRADVQLDTILTQTPDAIRVLQFRQLIRAEKFRQEFYTAGRPPEFLADPPEHLKLALKAAVLHRQGDLQAEAIALKECEEARPTLSGNCDGTPFTGCRDLNDATPSFFEVLTNNGVYYWVPFESVSQIDFQTPEAPRDLLWRRTQLSVESGPDGDVCVASTYFGTAEADSDPLRLARATDWQEGDAGSYHGVGQRSLLLGDEDKGMLEIQSLSFSK